MQVLFSGCKALDLLFDLGCLTNSATEIVELCASNLTVTDGLNLNHVGGVDRESLFHATTVRNTSYGECLGDAAAVLCNDGAFEKLNSFAVAFLDSVVNTNCVTDVDGRNCLLELLICKNLNEIHFRALLYLGTFVLELMQRTVR